MGRSLHQTVATGSVNQRQTIAQGKPGDAALCASSVWGDQSIGGGESIGVSLGI
jgi:hypothetical protein